MAGRPLRSKMEEMRTRLWLAQMMRVAGVANLNQFAELLGEVDTKKLFYRYAKGTRGVSEGNLALIDHWVREKNRRHEDGRSFYLTGPASQHDWLAFAPLWDALDGPIEKVWEVLVTYDPAVAILKRLGSSFESRCTYLLYRLFKDINPPAYWKNRNQQNVIAQAYTNGDLVVDIDLITYSIAAWRMAHFAGESIVMMDYIMIGLLDRAIPEEIERLSTIKLAKPRNTQYSNTVDFLDHLMKLDEKNIAEAEEAIKRLNKGVHYPFDVPYDYGHEMKNIKPNCVSNYLERHRCLSAVSVSKNST